MESVLWVPILYMVCKIPGLPCRCMLHTLPCVPVGPSCPMYVKFASLPYSWNHAATSCLRSRVIYVYTAYIYMYIYIYS